MDLYELGWVMNVAQNAPKQLRKLLPAQAPALPTSGPLKPTKGKVAKSHGR
jgi:hypothetical protein